MIKRGIIFPCLNPDTMDGVLLGEIKDVEGGPTCPACVSSGLVEVASRPISGTFQLGLGNVASGPIPIGTGDASDFVTAFAEVGVDVQATRVTYENSQYVADWDGWFRTPRTWSYSLSFTGSPPLLTRALHTVIGLESPCAFAERRPISSKALASVSASPRGHRCSCSHVR